MATERCHANGRLLPLQQLFPNESRCSETVLLVIFFTWFARRSGMEPSGARGSAGPGREAAFRA